MKHVLFSFLFFSCFAFADTVIIYDDGSTYTLKPSEEVYVTSGNLYSRVNTFPALPNVKRDYIPEIIRQFQEPDDGEQCWPWAGVAAPEGFSLDACVEKQTCEDGLGFGPGC